MLLNTLLKSKNKKKKRMGRGIASGRGKTCGRGVKGQKARSGVSIKHFEGGQTSLIKRLPKRGFKSIKKKYSTSITLSKINSGIEKGILKKDTVINIKSLKLAKIVKKDAKIVKLILDKKDKNIKSLNKIQLSLDLYSKSSRKKSNDIGITLLSQ